MITNKFLTDIGYKQTKANAIILKLLRLSVPVHKVKLHDCYKRKNGVICDYLRTVKGFVLEEAIVALNSEIEKNDRYSDTWRDVLETLIKWKEGKI